MKLDLLSITTFLLVCIIAGSLTFALGLLNIYFCVITKAGSWCLWEGAIRSLQ